MKNTGIRGHIRGLGLALVLTCLAEAGIALLCLFITSVSLLILGVGIPLTALSLVVVRGYANAHRRLSAPLIAEAVPVPYRQPPEGARWWTRLSVPLLDPATWRDLLWLLVNATAGFTLTLLPVVLLATSVFYLVLPFLYYLTPPAVFIGSYSGVRVHSQATAFLPTTLGVVGLVVWWVAQPRLLQVNARLSSALLGPTKRSALRARVVELARTRSETVDFSASELRRIERDLHDGAQARLVSVSMSLGLAGELFHSDPATARRLLNEAGESVGTALVELRDLVRGIHPPVLADRGLEAAIRALALASPVPTDMTIVLDGRLPAPVESAAYFAVAEILANVAKHSAATEVAVSLIHQSGRLLMQVHDNGCGGADPLDGTGISGIRRRLAAFDGELTVDSPAGGPTLVSMSMPCALS